MKKQFFYTSRFIVLAMIVYLSGCQTTTGNLNMDLNNYNVTLYVSQYTPKIDAAKYQQFRGKKMCISNVRNDAGNTTNFNYYSNDKRVQYILANRANSPIQFVQSFFWYAYQKAFIQTGIDATDDCSPENIPELWIILQSVSDDEVQLKITLLKNRETRYEKDLVVSMPPAASRDIIGLEKRAYEMIDLTVTRILDDPGFQGSF
jgi:hypothetical protein